MSSFTHERDAADIRTRIVVKGIGTDGAGHLIYSVLSTHTSDYPTKYQTDGGWSGEPYSDSRIADLAVALNVATTIGDRVWGPKGTMKWRTALAGLQVGDLIEITDPYEGQDHAKKVIRDITEVQGQVGRRLWEVTVGDVQIDITDLIARASTTRVLSDPGRTAGGGAGDLTGAALGSTGMVGMPKQVPVELTPTHPQRNIVASRYNTAPTLDLRQGPQAPPAGLFSIPPPVSDISRLGSTWDTGTLAHIKKVWVDRYGTPHKQKLATFFLSNTTNYLAIAERMTIREARLPTVEIGIGISFTYVVLGTSGSLTTVTVPFEVLPGEELQITCSGLTGGHVSLTLVTGDPL